MNATAGLGTIPASAIGLSTAVYDSDMNDTAIPGLLKAAGIDALRYPGGSYSDIYNWQTDTATDNGYVAPGTSFSSFMGTAQGPARSRSSPSTTAPARRPWPRPGSRTPT